MNQWVSVVSEHDVGGLVGQVLIFTNTNLGHDNVSLLNDVISEVIHADLESRFIGQARVRKNGASSNECHSEPSQLLLQGLDRDTFPVEEDDGGDE